MEIPISRQKSDIQGSVDPHLSQIGSMGLEWKLRMSMEISSLRRRDWVGAELGTGYDQPIGMQNRTESVG